MSWESAVHAFTRGDFRQPANRRIAVPSAIKIRGEKSVCMALIVKSFLLSKCHPD